MGIVLFLGIGSASLRSCSPWWSFGLSGLAVLLAATAALVAVTERGRNRAKAAGFAIFAWTYLFMGFAIDEHETKPLYLALLPFDWLRYVMHPEDQSSPAEVQYYRISHSLLVIIFGMAGTALASFLQARSVREGGRSPTHPGASDPAP